MLELVQKELHGMADPKKAETVARYFKTGEGEYGEGDVFIGVAMPEIRRVAQTYYRDLSLDNMVSLLQSDIHEERMAALVMMIHRYDKGSLEQQEEIYRAYLDNTKWINNWDLVDVTAPHIVGRFLKDRDRVELYDLARSELLWDRRIAIVSTHYFIRHCDFDATMQIADILLQDEHDLIHKSVGWMLREVGKRNQVAQEYYLKARYKQMPRTMLRYAIERFEEPLRQAYLKGKV